LENQINGQISFKRFLEISFDKPSPDHFTFSRFPSRLTKEAIASINNTVLQQFAGKGLTINEGIAVDAMLVQFTSRSIDNDEIRKQKEHRETTEGNLDKNGNPLKFSRGLDSDWTVKNNIPHYGFKEHVSVDIHHGFVLAAALTPASVHDSHHLPYCVASSYHTDAPIQKVYADKGYFGEPNRSFLHMNQIEDGIMRKATRSTSLTAYEKERNKQISKKRYIVEQYFGLSYLHNDAFRARFLRIIKNLIDIS
jgi:IS5 family transposase